MKRIVVAGLMLALAISIVPVSVGADAPTEQRGQHIFFAFDECSSGELISVTFDTVTYIHVHNNNFLGITHFTATDSSAGYTGGGVSIGQGNTGTFHTNQNIVLSNEAGDRFSIRLVHVYNMATASSVVWMGDYSFKCTSS